MGVSFIWIGIIKYLEILEGYNTARTKKPFLLIASWKPLNPLEYMCIFCSLLLHSTTSTLYFSLVLHLGYGFVPVTLDKIAVSNSLDGYRGVGACILMYGLFVVTCCNSKVSSNICTITKILWHLVLAMKYDSWCIEKSLLPFFFIC